MTIFLSEDNMPVNLNSPAIGAGRINADDLAAARQHSTGRILNMRRVTLLPAGCDDQGRHATRDWHQWPDTIATDYSELDDCAPEGGKHAEPAPAMESMLRYRRTRSNVALAVLLALAGYAAHIAWPLI